MFLRRMISLLAVLLLGIGSALPVAAEREVLTVWDWWGHATPGHTAWYTWLETEFEARYPDIDVEFHFHPWSGYLDKLVTGVAGGAGPDVAQVSVAWARDLYNQGILLELNDYVAASPSSAPDQFVPPTQVYNQLDGRIYGITFVMDANALLYNKDHFLESGLNDDPFALATWDDFIRAAQVLTRRDEDEITRSGYAFFTSVGDFSAWLVTNGASLYNADFTGAGFNNRAGVEVIEFERDLLHRYDIFNEALWYLPNGTTSMIFAGTWNAPEYLQANPSLNIGVTSFPQGPSGSGRGTITWGNMFSMFRGVKNPDAAWRFIEFVTSLDASIALMQFMNRPTSPRLDFYQSPEWRAAVQEQPWMETLQHIALVGGPLNFLRASDVDSHLGPILHRAIYVGDMSPEETVATAAQHMNRLLAEVR